MVSVMTIICNTTPACSVDNLGKKFSSFSYVYTLYLKLRLPKYTYITPSDLHARKHLSEWSFRDE